MPQSTTAVSATQNPFGASVKAYRAGIASLALIVLLGCQSPSTPNSLVVASDPLPIVVTKYASYGGAADLDWNVRMPELFVRARTLVQQHTGVDLSDVTLNIASDDVITKEVAHETGRLVHNQFSNREFASRFLDSVVNQQSGTYAAVYAVRKNEVMVSSTVMEAYRRSLPTELATQEAAILTLLIHELVHAADDKRYNIHKNRDLNFRASFAQSAAFEGHAQFVTRKICAQAGCLPGLAALEHFMFGDRNPPNDLTQSVQAISRNVLEYSYIEGERFISELAKRNNGQQLIAQLLHSPPKDPIQIIDPDSYPNTQRERRNQQLIAASNSFDHPWLKVPWTTVQTSPLKGVNLRTDPSRRNAAVEGFTKLITSMVALQIYNEAQPSLMPIELTLMRAKSDDMAKFMARTLHDNLQAQGTQTTNDGKLAKVNGDVNRQPALLYVTREARPNNETYYTLVGVSGMSVVQIAGAGNSDNEALFVDYIDQILLSLSGLPIEPLAKVNYQR